MSRMRGNYHVRFFGEGDTATYALLPDQLRTFLEYKGLINGVEIVPVSPRYSSQTCHACMHLGLRSGKRFKCTNSGCGWHGDADENASYNLSIIGGVVSLLRGSDELSCAISPGLLKHQGLAVGESPRETRRG